MSAEDMKASNKDVVASIEDAGKKAGTEEERKRVTALQAAFADDPQFVKEATDKGWSVKDAKEARFDKVLAENVELKTKNAELAKKAEAVAPAVEFAASDSEASGAGVAEGTVNEKDAKSAEIWGKNEKLRAAFNGNKAAFQACYRNDPETALSFSK